MCYKKQNPRLRYQGFCLQDIYDVAHYTICLWPGMCDKHSREKQEPPVAGTRGSLYIKEKEVDSGSLAAAPLYYMPPFNQV